jgi:hypothetical protein
MRVVVMALLGLVVVVCCCDDDGGGGGAKAYSANAKPIQWKYSDLKRRIRSNELNATIH